MGVTYEDKVFQFIVFDMKNDQIIEIDKFVRPENRERFVNAIKGFIESKYGIKYGFDIDINSDYTKFRKYQISTGKNTKDRTMIG